LPDATDKVILMII